jgi:hypothetical protein
MDDIDFTTSSSIFGGIVWDRLGNIHGKQYHLANGEEKETL